jgi:hypothetical protein
MHAVNIPTGKTFSRNDKIAAFKHWKANLPVKGIKNQLQLPKAILTRTLTLGRTVQRIPGQDHIQNLKILVEPNAKDAASFY